MKLKKGLVSVLSAIILTNSFSMSFANQINSDEGNKFSANAEIVRISEWKEFENSENLCKTNNNSNSSEQSISQIKDRLGEDIILHNNGTPIETNIFERKDGNELFAITINNTYGIEQKTYYFSNTYSIDVEDLIYKIDQQEKINSNNNNIINSKSRATTRSINNYKWDFYATGSDGVKRQQGSLATSVSFSRKSSNTLINGVQGSVWDIESFSQLLSRSNGFIDNHVTRLDVNQPNQTLYSWGPYDTGSTTAYVSLSGLVDPTNWQFPLNGFTIDDLSVKGSKYGRWQYKSRVTSSPTTMNTTPGIRVTNTKGSLLTKLSQTAKIATPYAISNHSTGVITIYTSDR